MVATEVSQEYTYAYAVVSVPEGALDSLILPHVNGTCMQIFLDEVAARYPEDRWVMVMDGAGWHRNQDLVIPENMRLLTLPPYSPELNPVDSLERVVQFFFQSSWTRGSDFRCRLSGASFLQP